MKNKNLLIIIILLILVTSSVTGLYVYSKNKESNQIEESNKIEESIKKSPYTLEEIYEMIEKPNETIKELEDRNEQLAYIICHFYDYFNKETPFKIATIEEKDGKYKVIETKTIDYYEYLKIMERNNFYENESKKIEELKKIDNFKKEEISQYVTYHIMAKILIYNI